MRNSLKPAHRPLKERLRSHQNTMTSPHQRLDDSVGKTHVMKDRQPCHGYRVRRDLESIADMRGVMNEVRVTHHYTSRGRGGARGILEQSQAVAARGRVVPLLGRITGNNVASHPAHRLQLWSLSEQTLHLGEDRR